MSGRISSTSIRRSSNSQDALISHIDREGILGFDFPWSFSWYFTITGSEYFHIYLWIAKDLAWTQEWRAFSVTVGILALCWFVVPAYHSVRTGNIEEIWNVIGGFLWLFANFWWMSGEAYDAEYPNQTSIAVLRTQQSSHILEAALLWVGFYYIVIIPFNLLPISEKALKEYDDGEFKPRFTYFRNFRQYENIHMFFWLAKDLAWNETNISLWLLFLIPTILVSTDYFIIALSGKNTIIDVAHYTSTIIWVIGNIVWALGEFFYDDYDNPIKLWRKSKESLLTARWYSAWILVTAYLPLIIVYSVWIPLSFSGKFKNNNDETIFGSVPYKHVGYGSSNSSQNVSRINRNGYESESDYFLGGSTNDL